MNADETVARFFPLARMSSCIVMPQGKLQSMSEHEGSLGGFQNEKRYQSSGSSTKTAAVHCIRDRQFQLPGSTGSAVVTPGIQ
jgi:hypothetical protein